MKNSFIPNPDFGNQYKEIKCTHCEKYLLLPFPITEYEIIDKQYKYIEELHCHFDNLVNELQRFFPDTPIKDYFEMRKNQLTECINLLTKKANGNFTEIDKIILNQNEWFKTLNLK